MNPKIYKISANEDFFQTLSLGTISRTLSNCNIKNVIILLPTKYSCDSLKKAFSELGHGEPKIHSISNLGKLVSLKSEYKILNRFDLIAKISQMIIKMNVPNFSDLLSVTHLSEYFANFIYNVELHQVDLNLVIKAIDEDLAIHQQELFYILKEFIILWQESSYISKAGYNNLLIDKFNKNLFDKTVVIAGISSNIPSITKLKTEVASSRNGFIVMYGVDDNLKDNDWQNVDIDHGQYNLKQIFSYLNVKPQAIGDWSHTSESNDKSIFLSDALKPSKSCVNWYQATKKKIENIEYLSCHDQHYEAKAIIDILKNTTYKNAMIITPDDSLMVKIILNLKNADIEANIIRDYPLKQSNTAIWLNICLDFILENFSLLSGLTLLKHNLANIDVDIVTKIELLVRDKFFRGNNIFNIDLEDEQFNKILIAAQDFKEVLSTYRVNFVDILKAHIGFAEAVSKESLWQNIDGEELQNYLEMIQGSLDVFGSIQTKDYQQIFNHFLKSAYYRLEGNDHPITLLKPIDARLHTADLVIMAGVNEAIWPAKEAVNPCFTRTLLKKINLPLPEQSIGEEAYDFQCFAQARQVIITRAEKISGVATVSSRWILRILTLAKKMNADLSYIKRIQIQDVILKLETEKSLAIPPVEFRPQKLSVTQVEKLIFNPYHIYVDMILKLKKLPELTRELSALDFGIFVHEALELYNNADKKGKLAALLEAGKEALTQLNLNHTQLQLIYWSRFIRIAKWFVANENLSNKVYLEENGKLKIGKDFTLIARADRIEVSSDNHIYIIDYKTGRLSTKKSVFSGKSLQLLLEAVIGKNGGYYFQKKPQPYKLSSLTYIQLSGGEEPAEILDIDIIEKPIIDQTEQYISDLVLDYQNPLTPYHYTKKKKLGYCEYAHLVRMQS